MAIIGRVISSAVSAKRGVCWLIGRNADGGLFEDQGAKYEGKIKAVPAWHSRWSVFCGFERMARRKNAIPGARNGAHPRAFRMAFG